MDLHLHAPFTYSWHDHGQQLYLYFCTWVCMYVKFARDKASSDTHTHTHMHTHKWRFQNPTFVSFWKTSGIKKEVNIETQFLKVDLTHEIRNTLDYQYFTSQMEPKVYRYEEFCESDVRKEQELTATKYASTTYRTCTLRNRLLCTFGYHMETVVAFK